MSPGRFRVPPHLRRGAKRGDEKAWVESGVQLLKLMTHRLGLEDLSNIDLLDYGCGSKFTQALLCHDIAIRRYVGLDVDAELIRYLAEHVQDARFEYHRLDFANEMYNPTGRPLTPDATLPLGDRRLDVACLFSVLTHVRPPDFECLLRMLRRHVHEEGSLYFTAFIGPYQEVPFRDVVAKKPLLWAYYKESFVRELVERSRWRIQSMHLAEDGPQSHFLCRPA